MMTKDEMANLVGTTAGITKAKAKETVDALFTAIASDIALTGHPIRLPEIGVLRRVATQGRPGRNLHTGEPVKPRPGYRVAFATGSALKRRLGELAPPVFAKAAE